ncbi:porin [Burkholderia sp. Ac-20344]|uniref:porin n=1 Tax=Burkholderia sp. Ac-20344 TaxID=2703890 RepID=UPI00197BB1F1|nr:porin [Burkholderia sp. Ac-20344]MBN3836721.1 porin [Burkholderia sp. Ac-20344]
MERKYLALAVAVVSSLLASGVYAQSSVTLYGALDMGVNFTSNANGHHAFAMVSGDMWESSFGLKGNEDLGGGLSALFTLESGFNGANGQLNEGGRLFGRNAYVGLSSGTIGTLTLGRQSEATQDLWSPFTAAGNGAIGDFAAHPFDNDNADWTFRPNNTIKYVSPVIAGLQMEGSYGFSNSTGFTNNRNYSAALNYTLGSFSAVVAYMKTNSGGPSADNLSGAMSTDAVFTAKSQQNIDAGIQWTFSDSSNIAFAYSHTDVYNPVGNAFVSDIGSGWNSWKFNNFELNGHYLLNPTVFLAGSATYTNAHFNGIAGNTTSNWEQVALAAGYLLTKRTSVYVQGGWQHANSDTGTGLDQPFIIGSAGPSTSKNQFVGRVALLQKF